MAKTDLFRWAFNWGGGGIYSWILLAVLLLLIIYMLYGDWGGDYTVLDVLLIYCIYGCLGAPCGE